MARTLKYLYPTDKGICPMCQEYIILDGYVCFGCGYDPTTSRYTPE